MAKEGGQTALLKSRILRYAIPIVIGAIIGVTAALWKIQASSGVAFVKTAMVVRGDIDVCVCTPSKVTIPSRANLDFKTLGRIAEIFVKEGDKVVAGQVLAKLDMSSIDPQIRHAEAGLNIAKAHLNKLVFISNQGSVAAEPAINQMTTAIEHAKINLDVAKKLIAENMRKADLGLESAEEAHNIASLELNKLKKGATRQQINLALSQQNQALQALADAKTNYERVKNLNDKALDESDQAVESANQLLKHTEEVYKSSPSTDTAYNFLKANYLHTKATYSGTLASRERVLAANKQSLQAAQAQINAAKKTYETASAQYDLVTSPVADEDLLIAQSRLKQAEIALEMAKTDTESVGFDAQLDSAQAQLNTAIESSRLAVVQLELHNDMSHAEDVRSAREQVEQAQAALDSARVLARDMILKAPFSGKVASVDGKPGELTGVVATIGFEAVIGANKSLMGNVGAAESKNINTDARLNDPAIRKGASSRDSDEGSKDSDEGSKDSDEKNAFITLINLGKIEITASVDETEICRVKPGQTVEVKLEAYKEKMFRGKLTRISPISTKDSGGKTVYEAIIDIEPKNYELHEGMSGEAEVLISSKKNVLTVPLNAVKAHGKVNKVFTIKNGVACLRKVVTGITSDTTCEVLSGLKEREVVAIEKRSLSDGQRVRVR